MMAADLSTNVSSLQSTMMMTRKVKGPPGPPAKTFFCVFCRDIVSLAVGNLEQFKTHMESVHQVFYEFDILLALNFIDRKEKEKIIDTVKNKVNGKSEPIKEEVVLAAESFLKEDTEWGNLDNVQVVILDENTSIKDAIKDISLPAAEKVEVHDEPPAPLIPQVFKTEIKEEPVVSSLKQLKQKRYKCVKCDKIFENRYKLEMHMTKKFSCVKPVLECDKCLKVFKDSSSFKVHMAKKFSCVKPVFKCDKCSKQFKDANSFKVHMSRIKSCVKPKCEKCLKVFKGLKAYKVHMSRKNSCIKPVFSCEKCSKMFDKSSSYQAHIARTKSCVKPSLKCEDCLKVFSSSSSFRNHQSNKETVCKKRLACEKCGKLVRESKYKLHLNKKRGCVKISLKCDGCLKTFSTRAAARIHQLKKETVCKKRVECEKCGERYREKIYQKHILKSCVKVECQKCGEKFTESKLNLHLQRKRSCVVAEPKCDDCGKTFSTVTSAKKHMLDRKGTCNMKFGCENCGNSFNGIHSLKMHQRTNKACLQLQSDS